MTSTVSDVRYRTPFTDFLKFEDSTSKRTRKPSGTRRFPHHHYRHRHSLYAEKPSFEIGPGCGNLDAHTNDRSFQESFIFMTRIKFRIPNDRLPPPPHKRIADIWTTSRFESATPWLNTPYQSTNFSARCCPHEVARKVPHICTHSRCV